MSTKYLKHSDVDPQLWPAVDHNPTALFLKLGCLATLALTVSSWLLLAGLMAAGVLPWTAWLYVVTPVVLWVALLALPIFFKARGETLREYAQKIARHDFRLGKKASVFVDGYYLLEYGQKGETETLYQLLKEMRNDLKQK